MTDFVFPSDQDRADDDELNRVCTELEDVMDDAAMDQKMLAVYRKHNAMLQADQDALVAHVERLSKAAYKPRRSPMTEQVCTTCGPKWNGMYNTDHRCITCGSPTTAQGEDMRLRIARVGDHDLPVPAVETAGAAGLDIRTNEDVLLWPGEELLVGTGFAYEPPPGHALFLLPRSGLGHKHGIVLGNTVGLIDTDYRGELKVALWYRRTEGKVFEAARGERVAQLVCLPLLGLKDAVEVSLDSLSQTERGDGGFGSSGRT